jgi:hypothetical protein
VTETEPFEPTTYFGVWSKAKLDAVLAMLRPLGVRFYYVHDRYTEDLLKKWCSWDPSAADPYVGYDLFIHTDDLGIVGTRIVDLFPERKFGAE